MVSHQIIKASLILVFAGVGERSQAQSNCINLQGPGMRREIVQGTLQVHAVNNGEAVQTGVQRIYIVNKGQPDQLVEESKFSRDWRNQNGEWKIVRELDYLVNTKFN